MPDSLHTKKVRLLLLEPTRLYRELIQDIAADSAVEIEAVESESEALSRLENYSFHMICIADQLTESRTGLSFCEMIRAERLDGNSPILILASDPEPSLLTEALRAGATEVLRRSDINLFLERIAALLPVFSTGQIIKAPILVIEDDPSTQLLLDELLRQASFRPYFATNVPDGLLLLEVEDIDLILTDLYLDDGVSGVDLVRALRVDSRWETVPIMAISSSASPEMRLEVLEAGAQDFVPKEPPYAELIARLRGLLTTRLLFKQLERERERLRQMATTDPLTGLFNRAVLVDSASKRLAEAARHQQPVSMLVLDLDHFKQINDTHGHQAGDEVLKAMGVALKSIFRQEDVPARFGGEEFAVLLPHCPADAALNKAETLRRLVAELNPADIPVTCSIGIAAIAAGEKASFDHLFKRADDALYRAKRAGRNQVVLLAGRPA